MNAETYKLSITARLNQQSVTVLVDELAKVAAENDDLKARIAHLEGLLSGTPAAPLPVPQNPANPSASA